MATIRPGNRKRAVAISDLAEMGFCERKAMLKARHGDRDSPVTAKRRREGSREHAKFDRQVSRHHNQQVARSRDTRCFIASAIYGVHDPRTEELRQFRDKVLATSGVGRHLVRIYYATSPWVAARIRQAPALGGVVRAVLDGVRTVIHRCEGGGP